MSSAYKILKQIRNGADIDKVSKALYYSDYFTDEVSCTSDTNFFQISENKLTIRFFSGQFKEIEYSGENIIRKKIFKSNNLGNIVIINSEEWKFNFLNNFVANSDYYDSNPDLFNKKKVFFRKLSNHLFTNGKSRYYYLFERDGLFLCASYEPRGVTLTDSILFRMYELEIDKNVHQLKQVITSRFGKVVKNKKIIALIKEEIEKKMPSKINI